MSDFRKADPTYVNFKPRTAAAAIDKFTRHRKLGVPPHLWPEVFVECAADLPDVEMKKFESWLVNPDGAPRGTELKQIDRENEAVRLQLLKESEARDRLPVIHDDYMDMEDEKTGPELSTMVNLSLDESHGDNDFDMVTASSR